MFKQKVQKIFSLYSRFTHKNARNPRGNKIYNFQPLRHYRRQFPLMVQKCESFKELEKLVSNI